MRLVATLLSIPGLLAIYLVGTLAVAAALRLRIYGVGIGLGPVLRQHMVGSTLVRVRLLPVGAGVDVDSQDYEQSWDAHPAPAGRSFAALSRFEKVMLYGGGHVATGLLSIGLLGWNAALETAARTVGQVVAGAVDPLGQGQEQMRALWALLNGSWMVCAGTIAAKMTSINLLPLPPLSGFQILHALLLGGREGAWLIWLLNLSVLAMLCVLVSYGVALIAAVT